MSNETSGAKKPRSKRDSTKQAQMPPESPDTSPQKQRAAKSRATTVGEGSSQNRNTRSSKASEHDADKAPLNDKQQRFILEYLIDFNASQAAIRAGYSPKTAGSQAHDLLKKPEIQTAIAEARDRTSNRLELTRDQVIEQYRRLGFSDIRKAFDAYGQIKPIAELDEETAAAIQGYEVEMRMLDGPDAPPVPVLKVKWADRKGALDSIMRAQGWNSAEKHELTGKGGGAIEHAVRVVLVPPKQKAEVETRQIERDEG
ncbi:terminase small subunit [Bradyrhizobium elkanii]|uniref:terminase small subunit n=1 Tax=Bradyrhizobium elkanii TaxID=29448 RepID=UPI0035182403